MSLFVLDTDSLSLLQRSQDLVVQRFRARQPGEVAISVISVEEQLTGWYTRLRQAQRPEQLPPIYERLAEAIRTLSGLPILSFTEPCVRRFQDLTALKLNIGKMDLRIACIAREQGAILVTRNRRDFQRVPGLQLEDWSV